MDKYFRQSQYRYNLLSKAMSVLTIIKPGITYVRHITDFYASVYTFIAVKNVLGPFHNWVF